MNFRENLDAVKEKIRRITEIEKVKLIAVSKTQPVEIIKEALLNGIEIIGENKVQEATEKVPLLKNLYKEFHFIGHLQSNKISKLMELKPDLIHSIDKFSTADKINKFMEKKNIYQDVLVQVNTSQEKSKYGISPQTTRQFISDLEPLKNLRIRGLMTIGAFTQDKKVIRKCFVLLRELFESLHSLNQDNLCLKYLSMGMTNDYEIALEEGANMLRIGTGIFGMRN